MELSRDVAGSMHRSIGTEVGCRLSKALWGYEVEQTAINPAEMGRAMEAMTARGMIDLHFKWAGGSKWIAWLGMKGSSGSYMGQGVGMPFAFAVAACRALGVETPEVEP